MDTPRQHPPVKFVCSLLYGRDASRARVLAALVDCFGPIDYYSESIPFTETDYYHDEMGVLERRILAFERLGPPNRLVDAKLAMNALEIRFRSPNGGGSVNLDVGYVTAAKLILATTKGQSHRIHRGRGILADQEYRFVDGGFEPLPWTYLDYRWERYRAIFRQVRRRYLRRLADRGVSATARP